MRAMRKWIKSTIFEIWLDSRCILMRSALSQLPLELLLGLFLKGFLSYPLRAAGPQAFLSDLWNTVHTLSSHMYTVFPLRDLGKMERLKIHSKCSLYGERVSALRSQALRLGRTSFTCESTEPSCGPGHWEGVRKPPKWVTQVVVIIQYT